MRRTENNSIAMSGCAQTNDTNKKSGLSNFLSPDVEIKSSENSQKVFQEINGEKEVGITNSLHKNDNQNIVNE